MFIFTGVIIAADDFRPLGFSSDSMHEFHVVVQEDVSGEKVRLRANATMSMPLRLINFGDDVDVEEIRERLALGARIEFGYINVPSGQRGSPDFHEMDVIVPYPEHIQRVYREPRQKGKVCLFVSK